ncbi:MAG: TetR/AcrR family transcriptional regulator [Candidatus Eisenbacteria bacterium]|uniref:TetR/AcrR family transcriptional regulator n=1 Tax=Eiseniibacteriota bacterium TaxID=2212470 RepID=A0A7Y2E612_UNCEI|nr:TetR/AcrR family transcriptional regulator [Candidatus Eisenbacteria bacterium]
MAVKSESPAKERILRVSLDLFGRRGVSGATVGDIAKKAECSQAALYKYWEGKEVLAQELFESAYERLIRSMEDERDRWEGAVERVTGLLVGFLRFARRNPKEHALLFQVFHSEYVRWLAGTKKPSDVVADAIKAATKSGAIPPTNAYLKAAFALGMTIRLALFEQQNLVPGISRDQSESELVQALGAMLRSPGA